ncbi:MAG: hypothetical protein LBL48_11335 [Azoarcus sp.]|nr:hypothetical protein [Azoarcus sp.]
MYHDIDFIFENNTKYCPNLDDPFLQNIRKSRQIICSRIVYKTSEHQTFSVLLKSDNKRNPRRLLVYNHGHGGFPGENDDFAYQMFNDFLSDGFDILFVSMPFTGIDKIGYDFQFDSWDGPSTASAKAIENIAYYQHSIFELMNTGKSHFIRYFIDSAVVSTLMLRGEYASIDYIGLSGGAHIGLYTCSILKNIVDNCVLVAGVMPINLRTSFESFGDAEQISSSFHKANNIFKIINELSASRTTLHFIYNDKDPCCFSEKVAKEFKSQLESKSINVNFNIRHSNNHDYDPTEIRRIISYY